MMSPDEWYGFRPVVNFEESFDAVYGLEFAEDDPAEPDVVRGRVPIRPALLGLSGAVSGGVLAAAAEALASRATAIAVLMKSRLRLVPVRPTVCAQISALVTGSTIAVATSAGCGAWCQ